MFTCLVTVVNRTYFCCQHTHVLVEVVPMLLNEVIIYISQPLGARHEAMVPVWASVIKWEKRLVFDEREPVQGLATVREKV